MPLTVRKFNAQVKDPQSGQMVPAGLLSSDSLQAIDAAETAAITEIQQKGTQTRDSIPDDYTELSDSVSELKESLNFFDGGFKKFHVNANKTHSSTADKIPVDIKTGEEFVISFNRNYTNTIQFYGFDSNNTSIGALWTTSEKNAFKIFTASSDIASIGMTVTAATSADDYSFAVSYANSEFQNYKNADNIVDLTSTTNSLDNALRESLSGKINAYSDIGYSITNRRVKEDGGFITSNGCKMTDFIPCQAGMRIDWSGMSFYYQNVPVMCCVAFYNSNKTFISGVTQIDGSVAITSQKGKISTTAPEGTAYVIGSTNSTDYELYLHIFNINIETISNNAQKSAQNIVITNNLVCSPELSNGSGGNPGNANAVTARAVPIINNAQLISFKNNRPVSTQGNYYKYDISAFKGTTWYTNRLTGLIPDENGEIIFDPVNVINNISDVDGFGITIWEFNSSDVTQTLRIGDFTDGDIIVRYIYPDAIQTKREVENDEIEHKVLNARHAPGNSGQRLTLLHFSDLHANTDALARIVADAGRFANLIDDKICTGDIVGNTYAEITSWWDKSILTCIGNHDTASYSGGVYDWTALSMANRDAYYIAPFESGWNITHTSGTSYYYKDYTTQKVRLIVMDAMLYIGTPGAEASAQTAWLADLLSGAITNNLHVLIAIHSPHGGATAEDCSFSRYNQGTMPTYTDCNTPQSVIDAVDNAIGNGLHFIGYIVGHTHQDNIWDAENNGEQLMYCVTCATTTEAQWKNSDQDRSSNTDAYNLITIDTANTLVKIVRGGGANIDDHMRTRKAICFNYTTGEMVGEVL